MKTPYGKVFKPLYGVENTDTPEKTLKKPKEGLSDMAKKEIQEILAAAIKKESAQLAGHNELGALDFLKQNKNLIIVLVVAIFIIGFLLYRQRQQKSAIKLLSKKLKRLKHAR